jgi:hypothetical protein
VKRALAIALFVTACAPTPVEVDLRFPSLDTFLYADAGRLLVYEVEPDQTGLGRCPALIDGAASSVFGTPTLDTDWRPICDFRDGGARFDSVPPGPHAYVMVARDEMNVVLLTGCAVGEAYEEAPAIELDLYPTDAYASATNGRVLTCSSEMDKCARGCR